MKRVMLGAGIHRCWWTAAGESTSSAQYAAARTRTPGAELGYHLFNLSGPRAIVPEVQNHRPIVMEERKKTVDNPPRRFISSLTIDS